MTWVYPEDAKTRSQVKRTSYVWQLQILMIEANLMIL